MFTGGNSTTSHSGRQSTGKARMTPVAGKYAGHVDRVSAGRRSLSDMKASDILYRQEPLEQRVGACWRCKTPIEIMSERQWFVKIIPDEILEGGA